MNSNRKLNNALDCDEAINFLRARIGGYMSVDTLQDKIPRPMWVDLIYLKDEIGKLIEKGLREGVKI